MEFCVPTNWQREFLIKLPSINKEKQIAEVYGKLAFDEIGGARIGMALPFVSYREAKEHIKELRKSGFRFNYLLNTLCIDNLEFTRIGQKKLRRLLDRVVNMEVDSVTVANPYIMMWLKKNYPFIPLTVSAVANVDSLNRAKFWEGLGADKINFPGPIVNRNFSLIRLLRKWLRCKIQLVANNPCLSNCPTCNFHYAMNSHASQGWHKCKGHLFDYYLLMCRFRRLENPIELILSDWIRPEDIDFYQGLGVDSIKLVDRRLPTEMILRIVTAYLNRSYEDNLADLFPIFQGKTFNTHKGWMSKVFYLWNRQPINPIKILKYLRLMSKIEVFIDNKALDGFLKDMPRDCGLTSCEECGYCKSVAERVVRIDRDRLKSALGQYKELMRDIF